MGKIILKESEFKNIISNSIKKILNEVVYADRNKINNKKKTVGLTYSQDNRAVGNANVTDKLNTSKMDANNADTYEVPLKGGIISYNITDISGTEIMHFFKHKWGQKKKVFMKILSRINDDNNQKKPTLTVLWLDDIKNPEEYFKKSQLSDALIRNISFYKNIFNKYSVNWVWVKNMKQFQNYIMNNPMPGLISFDYDLTPKNYDGKFENGGDVASWFVKYCNANGIEKPMCYTHSANKKNGIPTLNNILGNNEDEYKSEEYEIEMEDSELNRFFDKFKTKVEYVVNSWVDKNKKNANMFSGISILPVDSSSDFNKKFVKEILCDININGLKVDIINPEILKKDLRNLQQDKEFIEKNKKFYDDNYVIGNDEYGTNLQHVNTAHNRFEVMNNLKKKVEEINFLEKQMINAFQINKQTLESENGLKRFSEKFKKYFDLIQECLHTTFYNEYTKKEQRINNAIVPEKYSKGPSIEKRKEFVWSLVKNFLRGTTCPITNTKYEKIDICKWSVNGFEMKKLSNSERLGLKNFYNPNVDNEMVQQEVEKSKNTILLIFDDNISGGATLSDVCYQCKQLGMENIIPITFGVMNQKTMMRGLTLSQPEGGYNFK